MTLFWKWSLINQIKATSQSFIPKGNCDFALKKEEWRLKLTILIICAALLAATMTSSAAINIVNEEAEKQAIIDMKVAQIGVEPVGNMLSTNVQKVWTDVPGEPILWIQSVSNLSYPVYPIGKRTEIEKNQTAPEIGGTIRTEKDGRVRTILSDGKNIFVIDRGNIVLTAPAYRYKLLPSAHLLGISFL